MPIHDWTRLEPGDFHHFHQTWNPLIAAALNIGLPFETPPGKLLTVASYLGGDLPMAYVESVGIGDSLPSLPIFLSETHYIPAPLETTYQQAWVVFPAMLKELIDTPAPETRQ